MRKKQLKGFTLIEILIVLVTASLLIGVLFRIYQTTADISVRIKHQKQIGTAIVNMQTILQNIADTHTIDYKAVSGNAAISADGWTHIVPLIDEYMHTGVSLQITASGELLYTSASGSASLLGTDVSLSGATFIIVPITNPVLEDKFSRIYQPGFWLIGKMRPNRYTKLSFPVQTFFSLLKK